MPPTEYMSWSRKEKRWHKEYRGKHYTRSPRQLAMPKTREGSRQAANAWWVQKQDEVDASSAHKHPNHIIRHYSDATRRHRLFAKWQRKYGDKRMAAKSEALVEWLQVQLKSEAPTFPLSKWQEDPVWEDRMDARKELIWLDRFNQIGKDEASTETPLQDTIKTHIEDYLRDRKAGQKQGAMSLGSLQTLTHRLNVFTKWVDGEAPIETINELLLREFYLYLVDELDKGSISRSTAKAVLANTKRFIKSRWELRLIDLPRNFDSKNLSIKDSPTTIIILTANEVDYLIKESQDRMRLYFLLMLNCGMTQKDIGVLQQAEVDWGDGRIVRARTKTRSQSKNVPVVNYRLWDDTFRLLKQERSDHPNLALTNEDGGILWQEKITDKSGYAKLDNIKCMYERYCKTLEIKLKPLKLLRKTGASKLEEHEAFGRYAQHFLGHAPRSVADRHYVKPSPDQFDKAVAWLGKEFGFETRR